MAHPRGWKELTCQNEKNYVAERNPLALPIVGVAEELSPREP